MDDNFFNYSFGPLMATDDLGRTLPDMSQTGGQRQNRYVGMFYFLWCGEGGDDMRPLDVTKILSSDNQMGYKTDSPVWGEYSVMHHWGEPMYGYYYTRDEWVMRKHIEMLTHADIDFLVFDTTNAVTYTPRAMTMLRLLDEYRKAGWRTPQVVFYTNTRSGYTARMLYDDIYAKNYMPDTWFLFDGKPLIIADEKDCDEEIRSFFTIKMSQWPNEATKLGGWPWMDFERPQRAFKNLKGEDEIINVSVAQHPQIHFGDSAMYGEDGNCGRSFHNGVNDKSEGAFKYGYNFAEQWERALEVDVPYVFVTGWNEWIMGRWEGTPERPINFVDCADLEYSRDIEPMKGGYFDNYYLQLINYVRRYKGTQPSVLQPEIKVDGTSFEIFKDCPVVYRDFPSGAVKRDCEGYSTRYTDESGRNEIIEARVVHDSEKLYFYVKTAADIIPYDFHSTWMNLFLNVSAEGMSDMPRWYGYNYIANIYQFTDKVSSLSRCIREDKSLDPDSFKICAQIGLEYYGHELMLTIPKAALGLDGKNKFKILFKWADSRSEIEKMEQFYTKGDCAPIGRLNYIFES